MVSAYTRDVFPAQEQRGASPDEMEAEARVRTSKIIQEDDTDLAKGLHAAPSSSPKGLSSRFNICVSHEYPPIPDRKFDWCAYYEGQEEKREYGEGSTPYMAVLDLINNYSPTAKHQEGEL